MLNVIPKFFLDHPLISLVLLIHLFIGLCAYKTGKILPYTARSYVPLFWFFILFSLAFSANLTFLSAHRHPVALFSFWGNFVILAFLANLREYLWIVIGSTGISWIGHRFVIGYWPAFSNSIFLLGYLGLVLFCLMVGVLAHTMEASIVQLRFFNKPFAHLTAHDAKQPLTEIALLSTLQAKRLEVLASTTTKKGGRGYSLSKQELDSLRQAFERIERAAQDVAYNFSRLNELINTDVTTREEKVSMSALISSILPTLPRKYTEQVEVVLVSQKDFYATIIPSLFPHVLLNLLKNAYLHGGASRFEIHIDGSQHKIYVRNDGRAISEDVRPYIFRSHFSTKSDSSYGLGLSMAKMILQASQSYITCPKRKKGQKFTEFVLTFPKKS